MRCEVKLRWEFDAHGKQLQDVSEHVFGEPISDLQLLELRVRQAQKALINPSMDFKQWLAWEGDGMWAARAKPDELRFTPNVVVLELHGAPVGMTMVDLPGLIQSTANAEHSSDIDTVAARTPAAAAVCSDGASALSASRADIQNNPLIPKYAGHDGALHQPQQRHHHRRHVHRV
jgi:hypothetical protein